MQGIEVVKQTSKPSADNLKPRLLLGDIKAFLDTLSEDELKQPFIIWGDETSPICTQIIKLTEDFINPSGDGVEPISVYADEPDIEFEQVVYPEGTFVFEVD